MFSKNKTHLFSIDVETDDLYGDTFAWGVSVWDMGTKEIVRTVGGFAELDRVVSPWCNANIVPPISEQFRGDFVKFNTRKEMRDAFWTLYMQYRESSIILADFQYPCESGFFTKCVLDNLKEREWLGPYPIIDLGTVLACADFDPDLDRFKFTNCNNLVKHNPIHDTITAAKTYFEVVNILDGMHDAYAVS